MTSSERTAASYDAVAADYTRNIAGELETRPVERGLLDAYAELVGGGPVADVGCGPGQVAGYLAAREVAVRGLDVSAEMVEMARRRQPEIDFELGSMLALPYGDDELAGVLAWFSVIHLDAAQRPGAYREFARVVRPEGWLALGFHVGDDTTHFSTWWDHEVDVDFHYLRPDAEIAALQAAGWRTVVRTERDPMIAAEPQTRRCYLLAQRAGRAASVG